MWQLTPNGMIAREPGDVAESKTFRSRNNVIALQFATQQSNPVQILPDDDFDSVSVGYSWNDLKQWHLLGDAWALSFPEEHSVVIGRSKARRALPSSEKAEFVNRVVSPVFSTRSTAGQPIPYSDTILKDSPATYLRLGETSGGIAVDYSTNGINGLYVGSPDLARDGLIVGDGNPSVYLNSSNYVAIADNDTLSAAEAGMTIEAWIAADSVMMDQTIIGKGIENEMEWELGLTDDGTVIFRVYRPTGSSHMTIVGTTVLEAGVTYHVAATFIHDVSAQLYLNGSLEGSTTTSTPGCAPGTSQVQIGRMPGGLSPFMGFIDEVAIYPTALPQSRIVTHYQSGTGILEIAVTDGHTDYGGIASPFVPVSAGGTIHAAVRFTALSDIVEPLVLQIIATNGFVVAQKKIAAQAGETVETWVSYILGSFASPYVPASEWTPNRKLPDRIPNPVANPESLFKVEATGGDVILAPQLQARLVQGTETDCRIKIDRFSMYEDCILWEFSNNGGDDWYEAYSIRNDPNGVLRFPDPSNGLKWRVTSFRAGIAVSGLQMRPWYEGIQNSRSMSVRRGPNVSVYDQNPPIQQDPAFQVWNKPIPREWFLDTRKQPSLV